MRRTASECSLRGLDNGVNSAGWTLYSLNQTRLTLFIIRENQWSLTPLIYDPIDLDPIDFMLLT